VVVGPGSVGRLDPDQYAAVILSNVQDPGPLVERLERYVRAGGGLLISVGDRVNPQLYNNRLVNLIPASIGEVKAAAPDLTGEKAPSLAYPESNHPIFQVFREAGAPVFGTVSFYRLMPTAPSLKADARVLLKYSNGLPALLERQVGAGRVLLFTSSLDRDWTDFPLKSIFLPFVQEATHYLAHNPSGEEQRQPAQVGQPVWLEGSTRGQLVVVRPDGREVPLDVVGTGTESRRQVFREADIPGHYQVLEKTEQGERLPRPELDFAVNTPSLESELTPLELDKLKTVLEGLTVVIEGQAEQNGSVPLERKRVLSHGLLWAFLVALTLEGLAAALRQRSREDEVLVDVGSGQR
jgi:hypothetical protein